MINLEELSLYLAIVLFNSADYLNGVQLRDKILQYLPRMKKCHFNIDTTTIKRNSDLVLPSNDDIQRSFIGEPFRSVGSHVEVFGKTNGTGTHAYSPPHQFYSRCHIFSLPYRFPDLGVSIQLFPKWHFRKSPHCVASRCSSIRARLLSYHLSKLPISENLVYIQRHATSKPTDNKNTNHLPSLAPSGSLPVPCGLCDAVSRRWTLSIASSAWTSNQLDITDVGDEWFHQRCDSSHVQSIEVPLHMCQAEFVFRQNWTHNKNLTCKNLS